MCNEQLGNFRLIGACCENQWSDAKRVRPIGVRTGFQQFRNLSDVADMPRSKAGRRNHTAAITFAKALCDP